MSSLKPPSLPERIAGSSVTEATLTAVAALTGGPLAALLPVLAKSLASERQRKRIEEALVEIDTTLQRHEKMLRDLSDEQYKLINEAILALLQTTNPTKIAYLRRAVQNSLSIQDILPQESVALSRIVRDISADEADFLVRNFEYERIQVTSGTPQHERKVLVVHPASAENLVVTGLVSLGLLEAAESTWGDSGLLRYSNIVAKLLVLLHERT